MPIWVKPTAWGAVLGSIATMILGFGFAGWMLGSTGDRLAKQRADIAVTTALVPLCVAQSKSDKAATKKLTELRALASTYDQQEFVTKTGWATVPGSETPNRDVAEACASALLKTASK